MEDCHWLMARLADWIVRHRIERWSPELMWGGWQNLRPIGKIGLFVAVVFIPSKPIDNRLQVYQPAPHRSSSFQVESEN